MPLPLSDKARHGSLTMSDKVRENKARRWAQAQHMIISRRRRFGHYEVRALSGRRVACTWTLRDLDEVLAFLSAAPSEQLAWPQDVLTAATLAAVREAHVHAAIAEYQRVHDAAASA